MISRKYNIYNIQNDGAYIAIECDVENAETLNMFLNTDIRAFEDWIKADFDKVLSGESEYEEVSGNVCSAEISPLTTKIYDMLIEDDEEYYASCCEVDTKELRKLIDEWCDKVREFKREHNK